MMNTNKKIDYKNKQKVKHICTVSCLSHILDL